jgi:sugar lactone lactonase YvrE
MQRVKTLLTGLAMGESPRWHDDRLWFSDWGAQEIIPDRLPKVPKARPMPTSTTLVAQNQKPTRPQ